ncbi:MAG: c-type cytochrome [Bacteroidetes bacterium]|nr:c-type cytochrome [Bacteroidota bacterium]
MPKHAAIKRKVVRLTLAVSFSLILSGVFLSATKDEGYQKGKQIFEKNCAVCHKISTEKLVGPGLKDVTKRRDKAWMRKFIRGSQDLVKSGDKTANEVFKANGMIPMPDHKFLTDDDLTNLIGYIENFKPEAARAVTVDITKKDGFTNEEIKRGERLFMGVIPFEKGITLNCSSCHATQNTDTLNFNPSLYDLSVAWSEPNGTNVYQVLSVPTSQRMTDAHKGLQLSDKEIYDITAYFSVIAKTGLTNEKTFPARLLLFLVLGFLMALALADLIYFKKVKYKLVHILIIVGGLSVHTTMAIQEGIKLGRTKNYAPDQPIKFSHKVHAGQNKTDCQYCHSIATYSKSAGIPSPSLCMNCHKVVTQGTRSGKFEINKIYRAIQSGKSIPWVRIHKLPDHVFFSHAQHVEVGKVKCQECHGRVEEMDLVKQAADLSMGWCVNCHRRTAVQFTDNKYYDSYKKLHEKLKAGGMTKVTVEKIGGLDCSKCHY